MEDFKHYQNNWAVGGEITVTGIRSAINTVISCMYFTILCYAMLWHATLYFNSPNKIKCNGGFNNICNTQIFPGLHY